VVDVAVHDDVKLAQLVHWKLVGDWVQFAVNVTLPLTVGNSLLAVTVHKGGPGCCQFSTATANDPKPLALRPATWYTRCPADASVVVQLFVLLLQPGPDHS
jgi:hypothetical protein